MKSYKDIYLEKIKESYDNYLVSPRSSNKVIPIHSFIAKSIQDKIGEDYKVKADGYDVGRVKGETKEHSLKGLYYNKNVDISILKDDVALASIGVKFICGNYSQNANNYFENLMGETANIRANNEIYSHLIIIPEYVPYYNSKGVCTKIEYIQDHHLVKYKRLLEESVKEKHRPNSLLLTLIDTGNEGFFTKSIRDSVPVIKDSESFRKGVNINYSKLGANSKLSDDIKLFIKEQNDIDKYLDEIIELALEREASLKL